MQSPGACRRWARFTASDGTPIPTNTTSPLFSSFEARATISSLVVYSGISESVVDRRAHLHVGLERRVTRPQLPDVGGAVGDAVDPFVEVGLEPGFFLGDAVPLDVEIVVAIVAALHERGVRAERLVHDRAHDD